VAIAAVVSDVFLGSAATTVGLVVGACLERWRDNTKWKRDEDARWTSDLRVLYRDLIAAGDRFWSHTNHARMLERRLKRMDGTESDRLIALMSDAHDGMERELQAALSIVAEIQLIGSQPEADTTKRYGAELVAASFHYSDSSLAGQLEVDYNIARRTVVDVARSSLRKV
jgi:hypothetical protein